MTKQKTAKELNEQKWKRMNLIMEKFKEKPMSTVEIEQLISGKAQVDKIVKRSVQNYMAELIALGLVHHNSEAGVYELADSKQVFQSEYDYNIALKHSKLLTLSTSENQRLDQMNPYSALDLLAYDDKENRDIDDQCLSQHIRTGYYELHLLLQKYRKTSYLKEKGLQLEPLYSPKERKQVKEFQDLRDLLVGKISSIVNDVRHFIPLQGFCDCCPHRRITIKGKS